MGLAGFVMGLGWMMGLGWIKRASSDWDGDRPDASGD